MKIYTHNFNPGSNSGPNKFARSLLTELINQKGYVMSLQEGADAEFCLIQQSSHKQKPMLLRLDGIYFNSAQDYKEQNAMIKLSYQNADAVVFQSNFNKKLTEAWFGVHPNSYVVHNAYLGEIVKDQTFKMQLKDKEIWSCASSWRPHKRLVDNVRYFIRWSPQNAIFLVAGSGYSQKELSEIKNLLDSTEMGERKVIMLGQLNYYELRQLYDASTTFVHLSYLDHCPNVVVDAYAHGCEIVCASSGGTSEIAWNCKVVQDEVWDFKPTELYKPPALDIENIIDQHVINVPSIEELGRDCLEKYNKIFRSLI